MPYYVYKIGQLRVLEKLAEYGGFSEASRAAKALRSEAGEEADFRIKVIFAGNELEAEDLLSSQGEFIRTGEDE